MTELPVLLHHLAVRVAQIAEENRRNKEMAATDDAHKAYRQRSLTSSTARLAKWQGWHDELAALLSKQDAETYTREETKT